MIVVLFGLQRTVMHYPDEQMAGSLKSREV
jgi:hypothetical protein